MREKMVTRTIISSRVEMVSLNLETMQPNIGSIELPIDTEDENLLLKVAKKGYETDTTKIVSVKYLEKREKLYGMTENDFLYYSVELDPTTRKPLN